MTQLETAGQSASQTRKETLTARQQVVLDAIRTWIEENGYPPTIRELGKVLEIRSLRGVTTHLDAIAKKGFLKRQHGARSITLVDQAVSKAKEMLKIPVLGRIQAGEPVLAQESVEEHVSIDGNWLGRGVTPESKDHFALRVRGESMMKAGIIEGDYVIVRQQQTALNGDIVVALLGEEATVKRFYLENDRVRLQPENDSMEPILVPSNDPCSIVGKVVAVFRNLN